MRNIVFQICSLLIISILSIALFTLNIKAEDAPTVIKVGYMLNYGTVKSPMVKGTEGYGYEYLNRVFYRAEGDYELEFVYCEWSDVKQMLLNGDIDIMGPCTYIKENESIYMYSDESFGENNIFLSTLRSNDISYHDYMHIDGSTIAVQENNPNEYLLYQFLAENHLDAEIVYFSDNDYAGVLKDKGYDYCLASSLQTFPDLSPVAVLGTVDFYYVTAPGNDKLMDVINQGMKAIDKKEYMYQEKLYLKYYDYSILSSNYITQADYDFIQEQKLYHVGIQNLNSPICYRDKEGKLSGIAVDAMEQLADTTGINYEWVEITSDTTAKEFASLDFAFKSIDSEDWSSRESDTYYEIPSMLVERFGMAEQDIESIGILSYFGITEILIDDHLYGREMHEYTNATDMVQAFNQNKIDSMILSTATLNMFRNQFSDANYISSALNFNLNLTISFPTNYSKSKIEVFNKAISRMNKTALDASVLKHSTETREITLQSIIEAYAIYIVILIALIFLLFAISQLKSKRKLNKLLNEDKLTGLMSRYKFLRNMRTRLNRSGWRAKKYSVVTVDIDNFKYINEVYGYEIGSRVLKKVADNLIAHVSKNGLIARFNDDNFVLLVRTNALDKNLDLSLVDGNGIFKEFEGLIGSNYRISFSIGVYHIVNTKLDLSFMIDCANLARAKGKEIVGTTVYTFTNEMDSLRITNNDIITNMEHAISNEEFILYYQPKVDLKTGKLLGAESLVRWMKNGALTPPNHFIPIFEKNGFMVNLDFYVLDKACKFIKEHPDTPRISVNLSGVTVISDCVAQKVIDVIRGYEVPFDKIDIEVTETAFVERYENVLEVLDTFKEHGITISMDDFGAGISSLNRLKNLPIDTLKIDREFIVDSLENDKGAHIIKHVVDMARDLGLETVAEGIETREQEEFLRTLGCDVGQGYYFSRPLPEKDFVGFLIKQKAQALE